MRSIIGYGEVFRLSANSASHIRSIQLSLGAVQRLYNSNIFQEFDKHYTRRT